MKQFKIKFKDGSTAKSNKLTTWNLQNVVKIKQRTLLIFWKTVHKYEESEKDNERN